MNTNTNTDRRFREKLIKEMTQKLTDDQQTWLLNFMWNYFEFDKEETADNGKDI